MSPFAVFLREIRLRNNLRQHELAELLGYEQAYMSALELSARGPSKELLEALVKELSLGEKDQAALSKEVRQSGRRFVLPADAPTNLYRFCHEFWDRIETIHPAIIEALRELVKLEDVMAEQPRCLPYRARARSRDEQEAEM